MSNISARFTQSPTEKRRYMIDATLDLNSGEILSGVSYSIISPTGGDITLLHITSISIVPNAAGSNVYCLFFVDGGVDGQQYEVDFLLTTSIGQILECVVQINVSIKL